MIVYFNYVLICIYSWTLWSWGFGAQAVKIATTQHIHLAHGATHALACATTWTTRATTTFSSGPPHSGLPSKPLWNYVDLCGFGRIWFGTEMYNAICMYLYT